MTCAATAGSVILFATITSFWTSNAFYTAFLCLANIYYRRGNNHQKDYSNDKICHIILLLYYLYCSANFLLLFLMIITIAATIATTAIRPGTNPAPRAPVVMNVPIWYTRNATTYPVAN